MYKERERLREYNSSSTAKYFLSFFQSKDAGRKVADSLFVGPRTATRGEAATAAVAPFSLFFNGTKT
jgi:hypothetical protein